MDVLAKIILRSNDAVRPLLHLITRLDNEDSLAAGEIRTMALDSISLTLHANSLLETQRKQLLFQGNKVVSALFDSQAAKRSEAAPLQGRLRRPSLMRCTSARSTRRSCAQSWVRRRAAPSLLGGEAVVAANRNSSSSCLGSSPV